MQLSMALVLVVAGFWLRYLRRPGWPRWIPFLMAALALSFTHLLGFGIAGLVVAAYCIFTRKPFRRLVLACIAFALGGLMHVGTRIAVAGSISRQPNDPWEISWRPFSERAAELGTLMQGYPESTR